MNRARLDPLADYWPRELARLATALADLNFAAQPNVASGAIGTGRGGESQPGDPATTAYRRLQRRTLRRLDDLAREVRAAIEAGPGEVRPRGRSPSCGRCRRGQRYGARWCDRCGTRLGGTDEVQRPGPRNGGEGAHGGEGST